MVRLRGRKSVRESVVRYQDWCKIYVLVRAEFSGDAGRVGETDLDMPSYPPLHGWPVSWSSWPTALLASVVQLSFSGKRPESRGPYWISFPVAATRYLADVFSAGVMVSDAWKQIQ